MKRDLLEHAARNVPRYTSYPTAPHFTAGVGAAIAEGWLRALDPGARLSLYLHVPFCRSICFYCGCHTRASLRDEPIVTYAGTLAREIGLVLDRSGSGRRVSHIHWGGGTPSILPEREWLGLIETLSRRFSVEPGAEHAIELDPRTVTPALAAMLRRGGVNRVNLGVQDFDPQVQVAIGRWQPFETVERACAMLREAGLEQIGFDLIYGLPRQTAGSVETTARRAAALGPRRIAAFGYAHVPWFKKHQRRIDATSLPDTGERLRQAEAIDRVLGETGYVRIGLDHYALPDDALACAAEAGSLRRNFQGYTSDDADALIGFGASAISRLPQGFAQNAPDLGDWRRAIESGRLSTVRGLRITPDDEIRGAIIERLMCDFSVEPDALCARRGLEPGVLGDWRAALEPLRRDGLVEVDGSRVRVVDEHRTFVRLVAAAFDAYLATGAARHAQAV